jgi:hypothetical protein
MGGGHDCRQASSRGGGAASNFSHTQVLPVAVEIWACLLKQMAPRLKRTLIYCTICVIFLSVFNFIL